MLHTLLVLLFACQEPGSQRPSSFGLVPDPSLFSRCPALTGSLVLLNDSASQRGKISLVGATSFEKCLWELDGRTP